MNINDSAKEISSLISRTIFKKIEITEYQSIIKLRSYKWDFDRKIASSSQNIYENLKKGECREKVEIIENKYCIPDTLIDVIKEKIVFYLKNLKLKEVSVYELLPSFLIQLLEFNVKEIELEPSKIITREIETIKIRLITDIQSHLYEVVLCDLGEDGLLLDKQENEYLKLKIKKMEELIEKLLYGNGMNIF